MAAARRHRRDGGSAAPGDGGTAGGMHVLPGTSGVNVSTQVSCIKKIVKHAGR